MKFFELFALTLKMLLEIIEMKKLNEIEEF
jgi:hypothetical protein